MPVPALLVITEESNGFLLTGYSVDGEYCGDTWHQTLEDAQDQAQYDHAGFVGPWNEIPAEIEIPAAFALEQYAAR